jgi:hypothetical protein
VHQAAEIVPLIHAADSYTITHPQRHTFCKINVVSNQERSVITNINDESLMA